MSTQEREYCNIYRRVSSKRQERGLSLEAQEQLLRSEAQRLGYLVVEDFKEVETASKVGRTEFNRMIDHCLGNDIQHIFVEKTDRLQRTKEDELFIEKLVKEHDLEFHLVKEGRKISKNGTSTDELMTDITGLLARHEIRILKERISKAICLKLEKSHFPGNAPKGYKNISRTKVTEARIEPSNDFDKVKKFLLMFNSTKYTPMQMLRVAKDIGLRSKRGNEISKHGIDWMLKNKFYCGLFDWTIDGETKEYVNKTPGFKPMITKKQWKGNLAIFENLGRRVSEDKGKDWKFKGLIFCGRCGRTVLGEEKQSEYKGKKYDRVVWYHCTRGHYYIDSRGSMIDSKYIDKETLTVKEDVYRIETVDWDTAEEKLSLKAGTKVEAKRCDIAWFKEEEIEEMLLDHFETLEFDKKEWKRMKKKLFENEVRELINLELRNLRTEYTKNETLWDRLYDDKLGGVISEEKFKSRADKIEQRQQEIKSRIEELEEEQKFYEEKVHQAVRALSALDNFGEKFRTANDQVKKTMIKMVSREILTTGGYKTKKGVKWPKGLYIEWNEVFTKLYDSGLVKADREWYQKNAHKFNLSRQKNGICQCN